jgi:hypothetical protein
MSQRSLVRRRTAGVASLAAAFIVALPATALADNETRFIGIESDGTRSADIYQTAVADDGSAVLGARYGGAERQPLLRDVVAGKTYEILKPGDHLIGADANLDRILFTTKRPVTAGDTNTDWDLYVWDRSEDRTILVSADAQGKSIMYRPGNNTYTNGEAISGDGKVVQYTIVGVYEDENGRQARWHTQIRADLQTGTHVELSQEEGSRVVGIGDDGSTSSNYRGVQRGGKTFSYGGDHNVNSEHVISPDGGIVAWKSWAREGESFHGRQIVGVDANNGNGGTIDVPEWIAKSPDYQLYGIANGASSVTVGATLQWGVRYAFGRIARNGNVSQLGQDILMTDTIMMRGIALSRNEKFAATGLSLVKLGDAPLPGTEPNAPSEAKGFDYLRHETAYCRSGLWTSYYEPTLRFGYNAQGSDLRRPLSAEVKVYRGKGSTATQTLKFGTNEEKTLKVGYQGNYRMEAKVTLQGGQVLTDTWSIDAYPKPTQCRWY